MTEKEKVQAAVRAIEDIKFFFKDADRSVVNDSVLVILDETIGKLQDLETVI